MLNLESISDIVGMFGVVIILLAYYLLNFDRIHSSSISYLLMNLIGAFCILFSLLYTWNLASVIIETAWIIISLIGIYRKYFSNNSLTN